jgi:hypothetical protein
LNTEELEYASTGVTGQDLIRSIEDVIEVLQMQRRIGHIVGGKINNALVQLEIPENLVIIGDIHGDLRSLYGILRDIDFESFLANTNNKMIFLGDYVDRGSNSIGVLYIVSRLKKEYPESVILMRGNHEAPVEFPFPSHDLPLQIVRNYGIQKGKLIYNERILELFHLLALATLIDSSLFIVHGGLPTEDIMPTFKESIGAAEENHLYNRIMEEILWNDPRQHIQGKKNWEYSRRGLGKHFGINISKMWLQISNTKVIVRGHEPCQGFRVDHEGCVMTLFSCKEAYPGYQAAYINVSGEELRSISNAINLSYHVIKI